MGIEIERKFLVTSGVMNVISNLEGVEIKQGYVALGKEVGMTVRVRQAGNKGFLTLKSPSKTIACREHEYSIPVEDVQSMLEKDRIGGIIEKTRYSIPLKNDSGIGDNEYLKIEVDVFQGQLSGLIVAEIELIDIDQKVSLPNWIGEEVSDDMRYKNSNLMNMTYPF